MTEEEIIKKLRITSHTKVLDIGGSMMQRKSIRVDTLVDIIHPKDAPYSRSKLRAKYFERVDVVYQLLPFKNNAFDVVLCTHTLEDLSDPVLVLTEMQRVAKRGFIATPSMGADLVFSHIDATNWLTGFRRTPGLAHHKWLFWKQGRNMQVIPKNYPLLYSPEFQTISWLGESEFEYFWEGKIDYEEISDIDFHQLILVYRKFFRQNATKIKKARTLFYIDNPKYYVKELTKLLFNKGMGFERKTAN